MQERFNLEAAMTAATVFSYYIEHANEKEENLNNSNKSLVILTAIAYFGVCPRAKLQRLFNGVVLRSTTDELIKRGIIESAKIVGAKGVEYKVSNVILEFANSNKTNYNNDTLYVFTNCLLNMDTYINKMDIKSWNILALMLEVSLKTSYCSQYVQLTRDQILSVPGNEANKLSCRKKLEEYGVIKPKMRKGVRSRSGLFSINKRAYVMERV